MEIVCIPDERLRQKSEPISLDNFDKEYKHIFDEMLDFMYKNNGVGLAGVQVGILKQILVVDVSKKRNKPVKLANPKIVLSKGKVVAEEGCLSVPKKYIKVERFAEIVVEAIDGNGQKGKFLFSGFEAIAVQHEMDHLEGKLILDYENDNNNKEMKDNKSENK